jgi:Domain of unknown function (DUF4160)
LEHTEESRKQPVPRSSGYADQHAGRQASVMPTVYRSGPYRAFFYSADRTEPPHVHVERDDNTVKFWLDPVRLESNHGFAPPEVSKVEGLIRNNAALLLKAWYDFFAD